MLYIAHINLWLSSKYSVGMLPVLQLSGMYCTPQYAASSFAAWLSTPYD